MTVSPENPNEIAAGVVSEAITRFLKFSAAHPVAERAPIREWIDEDRNLRGSVETLMI